MQSFLLDVILILSIRTFYVFNKKKVKKLFYFLESFFFLYLYLFLILWFKKVWKNKVVKFSLDKKKNSHCSGEERLEKCCGWISQEIFLQDIQTILLFISFLFIVCFWCVCWMGWRVRVNLCDTPQIISEQEKRRDSNCTINSISSTHPQSNPKFPQNYIKSRETLPQQSNTKKSCKKKTIQIKSIFQFLIQISLLSR